MISRLADQDRIDRSRAEQLEGLRERSDFNTRLEEGEM